MSEQQNELQESAEEVKAAAAKAGIDPVLAGFVAKAAGDALEQVTTAIELAARCSLAAKFVSQGSDGEFEFDQRAFEACFDAVCNPPDELIS